MGPIDAARWWEAAVSRTESVGSPRRIWRLLSHQTHDGSGQVHPSPGCSPIFCASRLDMSSLDPAPRAGLREEDEPEAGSWPTDRKGRRSCAG